MFLGARYAQKSVFANFCRRFASSQKPFTSPLCANTIPESPVWRGESPKARLRIFCWFCTIFFTFFPRQGSTSGKFEWFGRGSIYCIVIAALHYNSRQQKRVAPQDNPIRILVLLDISFSNNSQIASIPTTPAKQNLPKRETLLPDNHSFIFR